MLFIILMFTILGFKRVDNTQKLISKVKERINNQPKNFDLVY